MKTSVIESVGVAAASSFEETLKLADLDWQPEADTISGTATGIQALRKKLLYRSDTKAPLGIVGEDYPPSDPRQFLQSQYEFAESIDGTVVRAGFLPERSRAFAFIKLKQDISFPKNIREKGDITNVFIHSVDGWDGGTPRKSQLFMERLTCKNVMTTRELSSDLWVSHTEKQHIRYAIAKTLFLASAKEQIDIVQSQFVKLAQARMSLPECREFLGKLMPGDSTRTENQRENILELFIFGDGNQGRSRWDALNAVTEHVTHHRVHRHTDLTAPEINRFESVLSRNDTLRTRAYELLLN